MTHLSHLQRVDRLLKDEPYAASRLCVAPSTRMDQDAIQAEGGLSVLGQAGARVEIPGCKPVHGQPGQERR